MMEIFKTIDGNFKILDKYESGCWINLVNPSEGEISKTCETARIDSDFIRAALDEEESARIEIDEGNTLIVVDIPVIQDDKEQINYFTIPLGIVLAEECIITVCLRENVIIKDFIQNKVRTFCTFKKTRFTLQILYKNATKFLQYLKQIDKESSRIEAELHKSTKNKELIELLSLEKSLVYFSTSLKANELVMEKMLRQENIKKYPDDEDLLQDVIVENKQAIEMAKIYSDILSGTMDAFASVISNNLNIVMKLLAVITIIMAIPTMIASFFGMNVHVPMQSNPLAFVYIIAVTIVLCIISVFIAARKKMF